MSSDDPHIRHAVQDAVQPSEADIIRARAIVLERLGSADLAGVEVLVRAVLGDGGVDRPPDREAYVHLGDLGRDPAAKLDPELPLLKQERLRSAAYEALAELSAEGSVLPTDPDKAQVLITTGVMFGGTGWKGGTRVTTARPVVAGGYKPSSRWASDPAVTEIATLLDAQELMALLGPRGLRCWREAVLAFNRRLYLAAAGMAGAASEAAWYSVGQAITDDSRLAKPLEEDTTVRVIQLSAERRKKAPRSTSAVNELQAHAAHRRDLRNYGLHPRSDQDASLESVFTETGCLVLLMDTRRCLARLLEAARAAGLAMT